MYKSEDLRMKTPQKVESISALAHYLGIGKPQHPLITVFNLDEMQLPTESILRAITTDFYVVALKKECAGGKCRYGQQYYDFDEGIMYFIAPNQVMQFDEVLLNDVRGHILVFHPDFIQGFQLARQIKEYGYFSYATNEALHISEKEEKVILDIFENVRREINDNIDAFTQDLLVANVQLLLKYCDRFYNRQFLTRKKANNDILTKLEDLLDDYYKKDFPEHGVPTVQYIASELNLSPNYLSDMLKVQTGQTTKQHIQHRIIQKAKELLSTTELSVSEVAFQLGFEHPQSFHRLFKSQTSVSPLDFRASFN